MKHYVDIVRHHLLSLSAIALAWVLDVFFIQDTLHSWWFEDDPLMYLRAAQVKHFSQFFFGGSFFRSNEIIPMQYVSLWIDSQIAHRSAFVAYLHSSLMILCASTLIYMLMHKICRNRLAATFVACTWIYLPSTLVAHEFISARGYIEGLGFALIAILLAVDLENQSRWRSYLTLFFVGLCTALAFLSKEFYPTTLSVILFLYAIRKRLWNLASLTVGVGIAYAAYRIHVTGLSFQYGGVKHLDAWGTLKAYRDIMFIFLGSYTSWFAIGLTLVGVLWSLQERKVDKWILLYWIAILGSAFLTIYPVLYAVSISSRSFGTWFRTMFVIDTLVLVGSVYFLVTYQRKVIQFAFALAVLVGLSEGSPLLVKKWKTLKHSNEVVGRFLLQHQDVYIYDINPAHWFLPSLANLYEVDPKKHILSDSAPNSKIPCPDCKIVWKYVDGKMIETAWPL
ncbi:MAG: hypothetical protein H7318_02995 [Oligoflexus sp.]|nr:hypothetical protein [Oligoflexus sp.]